jgi:hypothetical protein
MSVMSQNICAGYPEDGNTGLGPQIVLHPRTAADPDDLAADHQRIAAA